MTRAFEMHVYRRQAPAGQRVNHDFLPVFVFCTLSTFLSSRINVFYSEPNFYTKYLMLSYSIDIISTFSDWSYHRNCFVDRLESKRICIIWMQGWLCEIDLSPHSWQWPKILRSNFEIAVSHEWEDLLAWNERDASPPTMWHWTILLTMGSRSNFEITMSQKWDYPLIRTEVVGPPIQSWPWTRPGTLNSDFEMS